MLGLLFFCKQKTAYEMRISNWSSDVCSSDLSRRSASSVSGSAQGMGCGRQPLGCCTGSASTGSVGAGWRGVLIDTFDAIAGRAVVNRLPSMLRPLFLRRLVIGEGTEPQIGRASCRERGGQYVEIPVVT